MLNVVALEPVLINGSDAQVKTLSLFKPRVSGGVVMVKTTETAETGRTDIISLLMLMSAEIPVKTVYEL